MNGKAESLGLSVEVRIWHGAFDTKWVFLKISREKETSP